jgi:predicted Zn-dependent protease with MMP-like domain
MSPEEFEAVVDSALDDLPEWVVGEIDNLHIVVEDEPSSQLGDILGIYEGVSLPERAADYWGALPDRIVIFRQPHLRMQFTDEKLKAEIRKTVLHEIAHHIGIDDDRLRELGWD